MYVILDFFVKNYIWFLVICLILIFALIGYFVDTKKDERFENKVELDKEIESKMAGATNMTLNQMVNKEATPQAATQPTVTVLPTPATPGTDVAPAAPVAADATPAASPVVAASPTAAAQPTVGNSSK